MSRVVYAVVDDMFFAAKIRATAEAVGVEVLFPRTETALLEKAREAKPDLILFDLHNQRIDALNLAKQLKETVDLRDVKLLAFFSHVETELRQKAVEAGFDEVLPRSVFSRDLSQILAEP
jgi:CheY-like chemotaxis protein